MSRIFLSYRRDDTAADMTDRLYEQLVRRWGRRVFMDIDSLVGGDLFAEEIERNLQRCAVVLVVIGREWLSLTDAQGRRRVDDPADYPRMEVAVALRRGIRVIPVLVGNAALPKTEELPADIAGLADRQAIRVSRERFEADIRQLFAAVALEVPDGSWRQRLGPSALAALAIVALAVGAGRYLLQGNGAKYPAPPQSVAVAPPVVKPALPPAAKNDGLAPPSAGASEADRVGPTEPPGSTPAPAAVGMKSRPAVAAVEPRTQKLTVDLSGTWSTTVVQSPYSATDRYTLEFEITQQDDTLLGTVTKRPVDSSRRYTRPIEDGKIKGAVLSFHTKGEVSGGPNDTYLPYKEHYIGEMLAGKPQIAFKRFNDVSTGGVVQRFVAERDR
jgi:hypothetical protein